MYRIALGFIPDYGEQLRTVRIFMKEEKKQSSNIKVMRHSASHVMAQAVKRLWPDTKLGVGPAIENGFYHDLDLKHHITLEDLPRIEKEMKKIIKENQKFIRTEKPIDEAIKFLGDKRQIYTQELAKELKVQGEKKVSFYQNREFINMCKGPHIKKAGEIGAFKLIRVAGAYWKGDAKNKMLQRVYGVAFPTQKELEEYLKSQEEAEKRDHRKIGQTLELFTMSDEVGQGLPLWLPKGAALRQIMEDFILKEYVKNGYEIVRTPHIGSEKLFSISGHLDFYKEGMYAPIEIENEKYYLKPMNCPMHLMIYKNTPKSYRDLPIRYTELGTVYRYEPSGTLHGLVRVRGFTQDDGHIICRSDQLEKEIIRALKLTKYILTVFGFKKFQVALSVRDPKNKEKYMGKDKSWQYAEKALVKGIEVVGWEYKREEGEAVFYGPKTDVKVTDAIGRQWQISTLQVDFNLPHRFGITYIDKDSKKKEPFMLHRALLGSIERFTGVLIEHYAGAFPVWLSPVQVQIIPVGKGHIKASYKLVKELGEFDIRPEVDDLNETVGYKIRKAEKLKIPYMLVIGDKEAKGKSLNARIRGKEKKEKMTRKKFIEIIRKKVKERR